MQHAEKISIAITPDMLRAVRESVEAGEYASTSEVIQDAVGLWLRQRREDAERLSSIRERVLRSLEDPRPDLTSAEVDADLNALFSAAEKDASRA